jgi:hypothetical protein
MNANLNSYCNVFFIKKKILTDFDCKINSSKPLQGIGVDGRPWVSQGTITLTSRVNTYLIKHIFWVLDSLPCDMMLCLDIIKTLPLTITLDGDIIYKRF